MNRKLIGIFPTPVYIAKYEKELSTSDMEYIKAEGEKENYHRNKKDGLGVVADDRIEQAPSQDYDTYFFDTKLNSLKEFIKQNITIYVEEVITPKNKELEFYITQSWVNVLKPGENLSIHYHANSLISGVFYVSVTEGDALTFYGTNARALDSIEIYPEKWHHWNDKQMDLSIENNTLVLFPSRLMHNTKKNTGSTTDRISISFNVFVKGNIGAKGYLNELTI